MPVSPNVAPQEWLGICLATESKLAFEWRYIAWTVRNRMASKKYPRTARDVVLQRYQFSHFNDFAAIVQDMHKGDASERAVFNAVMQGAGTRRVRALDKALVDLAVMAADDLLTEPPWLAPFGPDVWHYWSPISMKPKGSAPAWKGSAKRLFTPEGVDPQRFVFAAGVP